MEKRTGWILHRSDGTSAILEGPFGLILQVLAGRAKRGDLVLRDEEDWETLDSLAELEPYFDALDWARANLPLRLVEDESPQRVEEGIEGDAPEEPRIEIESQERSLEWETLQLSKDWVPRLDRRTPVPALRSRRPAPLAIAALALLAAIGGALAGRRATALAGVLHGLATTPVPGAHPPTPLDPVGPLVTRAMELRDEGSAEALAAARDDLAEALLLRPGDSRALGALATLEAEEARRAIGDALALEAPDLCAEADPIERSAQAWEQASETLQRAQVHAEAALRDSAADGRTWLAVALVRALQGRPSETTAALIMAGDGPESDFVRSVLAEIMLRGIRGTE